MKTVPEIMIEIERVQKIVSENPRHPFTWHILNALKAFILSDGGCKHEWTNYGMGAPTFCFKCGLSK